MRRNRVGTAIQLVFLGCTGLRCTVFTPVLLGNHVLVIQDTCTSKPLSTPACNQASFLAGTNYRVLLRRGVKTVSAFFWAGASGIPPGSGMVRRSGLSPAH